MATNSSCTGTSDEEYEEYYLFEDPPSTSTPSQENERKRKRGKNSGSHNEGRRKVMKRIIRGPAIKEKVCVTIHVFSNLLDNFSHLTSNSMPKKTSKT